MQFLIKARSNGTVIASGEDNKTVRVFEGHWYYMPEAVHMEHLKITDRTYTCPYKGVCNWLDLENPDGSVSRNVGWVYRQTKPGYEFIQNQFGFYARPTSGTLSEKVSQPEVASAG